MSGPYAVGSQQQATAGQWPDGTAYINSYQTIDPSMAASIDRRQHCSTHTPYGHLTRSAAPQSPYLAGHIPNSPPSRPFQAFRLAEDGPMSQQSLPDMTDPRPALAKKSGGARVCGKCGKALSGQFVRALDSTYHLECFTCRECGKIVASKFFPVPDEGSDQYPLCETDYFKRLDLICFACGNALRGSYITALDRKYHIEHFTCSVCPIVFGAQDSYYEHDGNVYCHYHYSTRFAQRCHGCRNAILKQFVEIFRNGHNQHWHPECYMIHKYWNVRLHNIDQAPLDLASPQESLANAPDDIRKAVRAEEETVEEKVHWIWRSLSNFEERAATCISDMLLHVSNGSYHDGILAARKFIVHIELFFECTDELDRHLIQESSKGLSYGRESKLLCKKVINFFSLLSESQTTGRQRLGVTQELLSLVTGLAHYLKLLIRICLQGALKLERDTANPQGLNNFLEKINTLDDRLFKDDLPESLAKSFYYAHRSSDSCPVCDKPVEDKCVRKADRVLHYSCMACAQCGLDLKDMLHEAYWSPSTHQLVCQNDAAHLSDAQAGFVPVTRLGQYVHLLKVAHARLLATLKSTGAITHTPDESLVYAARDHSRDMDRILAGPGAPRPDQASQQLPSYEQALGDMRRFRSTRLEQPLGNNMKRARSSRIIDGPGGINALTGSGLLESAVPQNGQMDQQASQQTGQLQIIHDGDAEVDSQVILGANQMALDDISCLLQAEATKEIRPNAAKYAGNNLVSSEPRARLVNAHRRLTLSGQDLEKRALSEQQNRPRKYLSELSALEYFIVRHIAVLYMQPLLEGHFTQQELIDLIETKRPTFWGRFGKAFAKDKGPVRKKAIFGRSLEHIVERDGAESIDGVGPGALRVPAFLEQAVSAMRNMDMSVEGVFRKNGNIRKLKEVQEEIDNKGIDHVDLARQHPVQVAALLKKFLRELPDPVLTFKLHRLFITAARIQDLDKRRRLLHLTCCLLPKVHRDTMEVLFTFLNWVSSFHTVDEESGSKMDIHNLATVIAPNILYATKSPEVESTFLAVEAVHGLIEYNARICEVPDDILSVLNDPNLFEGSAELTTKEILKKYGEIGKQPQSSGSNSPRQRPHSQSHTSHSRAVGAVVAQDPHAWGNEASVRHVGTMPSAGFYYAPSSQSAGTPPAQYIPEPNMMFQRSSQSRVEHFPNQGPMGVTGAG